MQLLEESVEDQKLRIRIPAGSLQSHEKYLDRLKTYSIQKWFGKTSLYTPTACAKHGWFSFDKDTLKCSICLSKFYFARRIDQARNELSERHSANCPWRTFCVSNDVIDIDLSDRSRVVQVYESYVKTFASCTQVPDMDVGLEEGYQLDQTGVQRTIALIALCGWSFVNRTNSMKCDKCLRQVGCWLYQTSDSAISLEVSDCIENIVNRIESMSRKRKLDEEDRVLPSPAFSQRPLFDPIRSHYSWCPWLKPVDGNKRAFEMNIDLVTSMGKESGTVISDVNVAFDKMRSIQSLLSACTSTRAGKS
jgi:hypothetical protein